MIFEPAFQRAVKTIALDILRAGVDGKLPKTTHYQQFLDVGAGTVQKAMVLLENSGAVSIVSRGHQGRFVTDLDLYRLWSLAELGRVRIILPPPGPTEIWGITEILREEHHRLNIPVEFSYERGGWNRLSSILDSVNHLALVSQGSIQANAITSEPRFHLTPLGINSFYADKSIVVLSRSDEDARKRPAASIRVGIDKESNDHTSITLAEFPVDDGYTFIPCDFRMMPRLILERQVDVGIWHRMPLLVPAPLIGISLSTLRRPEAIRERRRRSEAFLVSAADRPEIAALLRRIDPKAIRARQLELVAESENTDNFLKRGWLC